MQKIQFLIITILVCFYSCDKLMLKRDNPLDEKNNMNMHEGVVIKYDNYYVYSDNNNDKKINKGETVKLNVSLKNVGLSNATGVKATFSTNSPYIINLTPTTPVNYHNIPSNTVHWYGSTEYYYNYSAITFKVSNATPINTQIPFDITIEDGNGNTWTDQFTIIVSETGANINYHSYYIYSDNNSNHIINSGETIKMNVCLNNTGTSEARGVKAIFSSSSSYITNLTPTTPINYYNIPAGTAHWYGSTEYYYNYYAISFTVSNTTPINTQIPLHISIVDECENTWNRVFYVTVK